MASLFLFLTLSSCLSPFTAAAPNDQNATAVTTVGWVSESDNQRSTISLLYSCLFTIFLCTWSAMHLNVPDESDSSLCVFWRRCQWMLVGVLAPEYVAGLAIQEWHCARESARIELYTPTISHAFFAMMGGYTIKVQENGEVNASPRHIRLTFDDFVKFTKLRSPEIPTQAELMDKSKGDWISKSITLIQVAWFISQLFGRAARRLPIATLELFTCAIIVCAATTYFMWWNKPLNVQHPIVLDSKVPAAFISSQNISGLKTYQSFTDGRGLPNRYRIETQQHGLFLLLTILAFTACHLIGWNFHFPTLTEQILWRIAGMLCAGISIIILVLASFEKYLPEGSRLEGVIEALEGFCIIAYILVRAFLLVEVFIGLRSVPVDVYTNVNWSAYIPHI